MDQLNKLNKDTPPSIELRQKYRCSMLKFSFVFCVLAFDAGIWPELFYLLHVQCSNTFTPKLWDQTFRCPNRKRYIYVECLSSLKSYWMSKQYNQISKQNNWRIKPYINRLKNVTTYGSTSSIGFSLFYVCVIA